MSNYPDLVHALTSAYDCGKAQFEVLFQDILASVPEHHRPNALLEMGNACWRESERAHPAIDIWIIAKRLYGLMHSDLGIARCSANLAIVHAQFGDDSLAIEFWQEAYRAADMTSIASTMLAIQSCVELCQAFHKRHEWQESVRYGKEAIDLWGSGVPTDVVKARALMATGLSLFELHRYEEALPLMERATAIREELGDHSGEANCWRARAYAHSRQGLPEPAIAAAERAVVVAHACGDPKEIRLSLEALSLVGGNMTSRVPQVAAKADEPPQHVVRVFVSSTFLDFHAEREELVKWVFPELRRRCATRGVVFSEVDLRWGLTEEQTKRSEILPTCLAEIERCRPYFIGLLGSRYGWVPPEISSELVARYPWLSDHVGCSITELEFLHGALNEPSLASRARVYFRAPNSTGTNGVVCNADLTDSDPVARQKLVALKERVRASGLPVRDDVFNPRSLGEVMLADLWATIEASFPPVEPDLLVLESVEHAVYARVRTWAYVERKSSFDRLDEHVQGGGPPLVILGDRGSGKSALVAAWAKHRKALNPEDFVLTHFIGAGATSANCVNMMRRILGELNRNLDLGLPISETSADLRATFASGLVAAARHQTKRRGRIVLAIDGLDQLEDWRGAPDLVWLPEVLPEGVRLIISTLPGRPLAELSRRNWPTFHVEALSVAERLLFIAKHLGEFGKRLRADQTERIATAPQSASPLYLRTLLEELRVWGIHERLDERIDHYLAAPNASGLLQRILERYEVDYERDRPGLVGDAMSLLWGSHRGLTETELLDLLGAHGRSLPRAIWSPLFLAAESWLVDRSGLLGFFHEHVRQAVQERYVPEPAAVHRRLAQHYRQSEPSPRKLDELPWQLAQAGELQQLYELLRDLSFAPILFVFDRARFEQYWSLLEGHGRFRMTDAYRQVIEHPSDHLFAAQAVGTLLNETGHWDETSRLNERLASHYRETEDHKRLSFSLNNQACLLIRQGKLSEASSVLDEQRRYLLDERSDLRGWETWYGTSSMLAWERGDPSEAWRLLEEQERLLRELADKARLGGCLTQKSFVLHGQRRHREAIDMLDEALRLAQEEDDPSGRQATLGELGVNHQALGDLGKAADLFEQQAELCRGLGDRESLAGCLGNLGNVHLVRGEHKRALPLFQEMERIGEEIGHGRLKYVGRLNQARAHLLTADLDRAAELLNGAPEYFRERGMAEPLGWALSLDAQIRVARTLEASLPDRAANSPNPVSEKEHEDRIPTTQAHAYDGAVNIVTAARCRVAADPASADAQLALGDALNVSGLSSDAIGAYRRALDLRPGSVDAQFKLANLILSQEPESQDTDEALALLSSVADKKSDDFTIRQQLLLACAQTRRGEETVREFVALVTSHPDFSQVHFEALAATERVAPINDLCAAFEAAARARPTNAIAWYGLGIARQIAGDQVGAADAFKAAIAAAPHLGVAHYNLGVTLMDDPFAAEASLTGAIQWSPKMAEPHYALGTLYMTRDRRMAALHFREFVRLAPPHLAAFAASARASLAMLGER